MFLLGLVKVQDAREAKNPEKMAKKALVDGRRLGPKVACCALERQLWAK
jgi:hypothetical protein